MNEIIYIENFIEDSMVLFKKLIETIEWDEKMKARLTASFGVAYNYSQMTYPYKKMPKEIDHLCMLIKKEFQFLPNNCLINYYPDGKSKMGFHSDQIDFLGKNTGIAIISLGETRHLNFKNIEDNDKTFEYELVTGSLLYMTQNTQKNWQHSIPKSKTKNGRISLTFRKIK